MKRRGTKSQGHRLLFPTVRTTIVQRQGFQVMQSGGRADTVPLSSQVKEDKKTGARGKTRPRRTQTARSSEVEAADRANKTAVRKNCWRRKEKKQRERPQCLSSARRAIDNASCESGRPRARIFNNLARQKGADCHPLLACFFILPRR